MNGSLWLSCGPQMYQCESIVTTHAENDNPLNSVHTARTSYIIIGGTHTYVMITVLWIKHLHWESAPWCWWFWIITIIIGWSFVCWLGRVEWVWCETRRKLVWATETKWFIWMVIEYRFRLGNVSMRENCQLAINISLKVPEFRSLFQTRFTRHHNGAAQWTWFN